MVAKITIGKFIKYILLLGLAFALLYASFKGVKWNDFVSGLKSCNYYWIFTSMVVGFLGFFIRALRWRLLLQQLNNKVSLRESYDGVTIAYLTNFILPRAGEIARCGVIAKTKKATFEGALGTVVLERGFDLICLLCWVALLLIFKWSEFGTFISRELFEPLISNFSSNLIYIAIGILFFFIATFVLIWRLRKKILKLKFFRKIADIIKGLLDGLLTAFKMKHKWLFLLYTLLLWSTYWLTSYTTIQAFPSVGELGVIDALFLMIIGGLGWVVPVQGGLGAYHFIVSLALASVYAIPQTTGVIFATISHESQALTMIICGLLSLISISIWNKKNIKPKHNHTNL
ncbi:MAG: lysylphosphatidylglycerol synthase transmembrane domain-containing protein [Bacteroidales bacterium]